MCPALSTYISYLIQISQRTYERATGRNVGSLKAEPERRIWVQVVYLGGGSRRLKWGKGHSEMGREKSRKGTSMDR